MGKSVVFNGSKTKTASGLKKSDLVKNKAGKIVSRKASANGKRAYARIKGSTVAVSVATSFAGLLVLRTLLGIGEAGFTGIPFYLSFFFKREELALRTGFFISAAPLATSFASTLAWAIVK